MYFWNIKSLKQEIRENRLRETWIFYYILIYIVLNAIGIETVAYLPNDESNAWDYAQSLLNIVIAVVGTTLAYRANGGAAGSQFAAKYFSISLVTLIRFIVYFIPVAVAIFAFYWSALDSEQPIQTEWFEVALFSLWYAAFYLAIAKHIRDTARP